MSIMAHKCGHILCRHTLYLTVLRIIEDMGKAAQDRHTKLTISRTKIEENGMRPCVCRFFVVTLQALKRKTQCR